MTVISILIFINPFDNEQDKLPISIQLCHHKKKSISRLFMEELKSSSSHPIYPVHRKLRSGSREGKTAATHTHKEERDQRSPPAQRR